MEVARPQAGGNVGYAVVGAVLHLDGVRRGGAARGGAGGSRQHSEDGDDCQK